MIQELEALRQAALAALDGAHDDAALEAVRIEFVGRKGRLTHVLRGIKDLEPAERGRVGGLANEIKEELSGIIDERAAALAAAARARGPVGADPTLPGLRPVVGRPHLIHQTIDRITDIFSALGFTLATGPEVERVDLNFDMLNIGPEHPSRQPGDTFFLSDATLLRTHTSPVQVRAMRAQEPPIRIISPGRVYRREAVDATHSCEFHQVEILYVDRGVTLRDLKGCLSAFAREMFGPETRTRLRPSYFPFVEPGAEVDVSCFLCRGGGCRVCKGSGWIEILGAGMVHPQVLENVGYDPEVWTGYAAGMGVERIAMLRHGIPDIRLFFENDQRFTAQF